MRQPIEGGPSTQQALSSCLFPSFRHWACMCQQDSGPQENLSSLECGNCLSLEQLFSRLSKDAQSEIFKLFFTCTHLSCIGSFVGKQIARPCLRANEPVSLGWSLEGYVTRILTPTSMKTTMSAAPYLSIHPTTGPSPSPPQGAFPEHPI